MKRTGLERECHGDGNQDEERAEASHAHPPVNQFGVGRSTESITNTSTGPIADCSFRPSCSSSAMTNNTCSGRLSEASDRSLAHRRSISNEPFNVDLSITGRSSFAEKVVSSTGHAMETACRADGSRYSSHLT